MLDIPAVVLITFAVLGVANYFHTVVKDETTHNLTVLFSALLILLQIWALGSVLIR